MDEFKIGDKVELKSGGLLMTVNFIDNVLLQIECVWFDKKILKKQRFNAKALKKKID
jgi:uncharacterized protein YodC (DUF2158 family)